jgi:crotonobetainyl-CoA:carnitine CoA-transferase CaiB-like acyl-CoA transferase
VRRLVADADVVIENFKVGGLAKYGLDHASLSAVNPRLIYCSITGFGQTGPYAHRAGYDFIIQGMAGLMSVTGDPDGQPQKVGVAVTDIFTGVYAATAILAALHQRATTGQGQQIDMALMDVATSVMANQAMNYLATGVAPGWATPTPTLRPMPSSTAPMAGSSWPPAMTRNTAASAPCWGCPTWPPPPNSPPMPTASPTALR